MFSKRVAKEIAVLPALLYLTKTLEKTIYDVIVGQRL